MGDNKGYRSGGVRYSATPEELAERKAAREARKKGRELTAELRKTESATIKEWAGFGERSGGRVSVGEYEWLKDWQGRAGRPSDSSDLNAKEKKVLAMAQKELGWKDKAKTARFLDLATSALKGRLAFLIKEGVKIGIDYTKAKTELGIWRSKDEQSETISYRTSTPRASSPRASKASAKAGPRVLMQTSSTERWVAKAGVKASLAQIQREGRWMEDVRRQEKVGGKWKDVRD